jgi:phage shock protein E
MNKSLIVFMFIVGLLLAACGPAAPETVSVVGGAYRRISAPALRELLKNKNFLFVNVHTPPAGSIAETDVAIPYDQLQQNLDQLPSDKNAKVILYCRSGRMSSMAAATLVKLGYANVWELDGGMQAWQAAGLPLQSNEETGLSAGDK